MGTFRCLPYSDGTQTEHRRNVVMQRPVQRDVGQRTVAALPGAEGERSPAAGNGAAHLTLDRSPVDIECGCRAFVRNFIRKDARATVRCRLVSLLDVSKKCPQCGEQVPVSPNFPVWCPACEWGMAKPEQERKGI